MRGGELGKVAKDRIDWGTRAGFGAFGETLADCGWYDEEEDEEDNCRGREERVVGHG